MKIPIVCNGNRGYYLVHSSTCICCCVACNERAKRADLPCIQISPTEFERHSGTAERHPYSLYKDPWTTV